MQKYLSAFLLLIAVTAAQAEWVAVDAAAKPGEAHYFDPQTLQKNAQFRKIWILSSYDNKQKGGYHAAKSLYEFDCAHEKARSTTLLLYPDKKASGAVIGAHHEESQDWFGFSSHSIFRHIAEIVCTD